MAPPENKDIVIYVADTPPRLFYHLAGDPNENARKVNMKWNKKLQWVCKYPWAVDFGDRTPLKEYKYYGAPEQSFGGSIRKHSRGSYKYFVAVAVTDSKGDVEILTDDPEVDVDEDG